MSKRGSIMVLFVMVLFILVIGISVLKFGSLTGKSVSNEEHSVGPSLEEQNCMKSCVSVGCNEGDMTCMKANSEKCMSQCNAQKLEETEETSCMEKCVAEGCDEFDFTCQSQNQAVCEKQCGMIKEPEAKSEEEQCIRDCVKKVDPTLICKGGEGGEKGNEVCQKCAKDCEYLYAGPCLNEVELEEKKTACNTCEHCYGEPVMGDSGEGYECIVDISCKDASSEFGDDPGTGPGIGEEGFIAKVENFFESVGNFVKDIFTSSE